MIKFISLIISLLANLSQLEINSISNFRIQNLDSVQSLIQQEINQTKVRFDPIISTWIFAAILIPTSATLCVLVLALKYGRKVQSVLNHVNNTQSQTLSQMNSRISEIQTLVNSIHNQIQISQENTEKINQKNQSISEHKKL